LIPPVPGDKITLRCVQPEDRDFARWLYATTRRAEMAMLPWAPELKETFLAQQFQAQWDDYWRRFAGGTHHIVEVDGRMAGRLFVDRREDEILIVDITLAPEFRGGGLGTRLVETIQREAATTGKSVIGHVECNNRACSFWRKMGFAFTRSDGVYFEILWSAVPV
jgi:GNAT superfamily N-acetyltransferase